MIIMMVNISLRYGDFSSRAAFGIGTVIKITVPNQAGVLDTGSSSPLIKQKLSDCFSHD